MNTSASPRRIVLASGNPGKVREIQALLAGYRIEVSPQSAFGVSDADETGLTFVENAILKARHAARQCGLPAIADDSGIEVDALLGAPGIRSARFAGKNASDRANVERLLECLADIDDPGRSARFRCVMVLLRHSEDPSPLIAEGTWEGSIASAPRGHGGFGYDPVFLLADRSCTAAELEPAEKNRLSHRGLALQRLMEQIRLRF